MTMERALFEVIKGIPNLGVGSGATIRIYAARAPKNATAPFIIYQCIGDEEWKDINGPSGITQATMQIDVYHELPLEVKTIAKKLREGLSGYRATVVIPGDSPQESVRFAGISYQNAIDLFDQTDQPYLYRVSQDYLVTYEL